MRLPRAAAAVALFLTLAGGLAALSARRAGGFAERLVGPLVDSRDPSLPRHVPAVITSAFWAPDGDWNLVLRPAPGGEADAWFSTFWQFDTWWNPDQDRWSAAWRRAIDSRLAQHPMVVTRDPVNPQAFRTTPSATSREEDARARTACAACAGPGRCSPFAPDKPACRGFFSCADCLYSLVNGDTSYDIFNQEIMRRPDLSFYTAAAEVELNERLVSEWSALFDDWLIGGMLRECNEIDARGGLCGRKVWLSGTLAYDQSHDYKVEIHPFESLVMDAGTTTSAALVSRTFAAAAFTDDSYTDFYANRSEDEIRTHITIDLPLFAPRPPAAAPGPDPWVPFCRIRPGRAPLNVISQSPESTGLDADGACPRLAFHMKRRGGFWAGSVETGFRKRDRLEVTRREGPVEVPSPPGWQGPPSRFYQWKLVATAGWTKGFLENPSITLASTRADVKVTSIGSASLAERDNRLGRTETFLVVVPVRFELETDLYAASLSLALRAGAAPRVEQAIELRAPRPLLTLAGTDARSTATPAGPRYELTVEPRATGFLQPTTVLLVRDGTFLPSAAPVRVTLGAGESTTFGALAADSRGIELATRLLRLEPPAFATRLRVERARPVGSLLPYALPTGVKEALPWNGPVAAWRNHQQLRFVASPYEDAEGPLQPAPLAGRPLTFDWSVRLRPDGGSWSVARCAAVAASAGGFAGDTCTVDLPDPNRIHHFEVTVTVEDKPWGRSARETARGASGYVVPNEAFTAQLQKVVSSSAPGPIPPRPDAAITDPLPTLLPLLLEEARGLRGETDVAAALRFTRRVEGAAQLSLRAWGQRHGLTPAPNPWARDRSGPPVAGGARHRPRRRRRHAAAGADPRCRRRPPAPLADHLPRGGLEAADRPPAPATPGAVAASARWGARARWRSPTRSRGPPCRCGRGWSSTSRCRCRRW